VKPKLLVLHGKVNFHYPTYAESPTVREHFDVSKATTIRNKPDVVFCQSYGQCIDEISRCKRPVVAHIGGSPWMMTDLRIKTLLKGLRGAKTVACVSKFLVGEFRQHTKFKHVIAYPMGLWGIDHVATGVMPQRFPRKDDYSFGDPPTIICSMNMVNSGWKKKKWLGLLRFVDATKDLLKKHGFRIVCSGRGKPFPEMNQWRKDFNFQFVRAHHLDDKRDTWPERLRKADIFLHPSMYDSWGRVVADAMCAGVPSLVFQTTGPQEVGRTPVLCQPGDKNDIRQKFERFLDKHYRKKLGTLHWTEAAKLTRKHRADLLKILKEAMQ
jgi:glycosyltransferase involved in cell wall biosynthesis